MAQRGTVFQDVKNLIILKILFRSPHALCVMERAISLLAARTIKRRVSTPTAVVVSYVAARAISQETAVCVRKVNDIHHPLSSSSPYVSAANDPLVVIGSACEAGADEDDFHAFKRTTTQLDRTEKLKENTRRELGVKKGALSGTVVKPGNLPGARKVVIFK